MVESKSPKKAGGEAKSRKAKRAVDSSQDGVAASPNRIADISTGTDDSEIILKNSRLDVSLPLFFFLSQIKYRDTIFFFCREMVNHCQTHLQTAMMKKRRLIKSAKRVRKKTRWLMMRVSGHPTNPTHSKFKSVWTC